MFGGLIVIVVGVFFVIYGNMWKGYSIGGLFFFLGLSLILIGIFSIMHKQKAKNENNTINQNEGINNKTNELLEYKKLLDAGAISQEEFDKKKKEILN